MLLVSPSRWWVLAIQAVINLVFSLLVFLCQDGAVGLVVRFFAALAALNGLVGLGVALRERNFLQHWWIDLIIGGINLGMGCFILWYDRFVAAVSVAFLSVFIGIQALFLGSMGFGVSLELASKLKVKRTFVFFGLLSITGGILVLAAPYAIAFDMLNLIAIYAALAGLGLGLDSLRMKRMVH